MYGVLMDAGSATAWKSWCGVAVLQLTVFSEGFAPLGLSHVHFE